MDLNSMHWWMGLCLLVAAVAIVIAVVCARKCYWLRKSVNELREALFRARVSVSSSFGNHNPCGISNSSVIAIASEINRLENNLWQMNPETRGYKQLARAVRSMKDCLKSEGYEIVDYLGKPYIEGMMASVTFVADETLPEGSAVINSVNSPQINYMGKMIKSAQITVGQNFSYK